VITTNTTLTADHQGPVVIGADGITLDCAGHTISGPGNVGIDLSGRTGVTVKNCTVTGFGIGFQLGNSFQNTLVANASTGNGASGFAVEASNGNSFNSNKAEANGDVGFDLTP
jgi:parallel beta-helix repeat protein